MDIQPGEKIARELDRERKHQLDMTIKIARKKDSVDFQKLELAEREAMLHNEVDLERKGAQLRADLAADQHIEKLKSIKREIELARLKQDQSLESNMRSDETKLEFLRSLKEMGVDLTQFMCAVGGGATLAQDVLSRSPATTVEDQYGSNN